jgi:hypothetical protein
MHKQMATIIRVLFAAERERGSLLFPGRHNRVSRPARIKSLQYQRGPPVVRTLHEPHGSQTAKSLRPRFAVSRTENPQERDILRLLLNAVPFSKLLLIRLHIISHVYLFAQRVFEEGRSMFWEITVSVTLSKNMHMQMCFRDRVTLLYNFKVFDKK